MRPPPLAGGGLPLLLVAPVSLAALSGCDRAPDPGAGRAPFPTFTDVTEAVGIRFQHDNGFDGVRYRVVETVNGGVALLDYDLDGRLDIYFTNGCKLEPGPIPPRDALYRQGPDGKFTDVAREAGVDDPLMSLGVSVADVDGDSDPDIFVTNQGRNRLYRNDGNATFTDIAPESGVAGDSMHSGSAFLDMETDGDLDLYVASYVEEKGPEYPACVVRGVPGYWPPRNYPAARHRLYENKGDGRFADVSEVSGIRNVDPPGRGLGVIAADLNDDGHQDIYVANDMTANYLFLGDGKGKFAETGLLSGAALGEGGEELGSMGVDAADYDGDQHLDLCVTNYQDQINNLYRCSGPAAYEEMARLAGISPGGLPEVSWGVGFFDFDCDGAPDLFIANGHLNPGTRLMDESTSYAQPKKLFRNAGQGRFENVTAGAGAAVGRPRVSRGAAFGDIDNDGDVDAVVVEAQGSPEVLRNDGGSSGAWCLVELRGAGRNRDGLGARVTLSAGGRTLIAERRGSGSYLSANDPRLHFGLGPARVIDRIAVRWPDGSRDMHEGLPVRRLIRITQGRREPEVVDLSQDARRP
ncbi:MAG: CRTAC1 family protein [Planctomycetes bacterium]|nr:CRTAC1 family protein [Planctomycetota bacterium]